jgi:ABC-2 type transport system permease protein
LEKTIWRFAQHPNGGFRMKMLQSLSRPSLGAHLRVLVIVAVKDWRQYWRYPLNALASLLHPLIWLSPVYFMGQTFSVNGRAEAFAGYSGTSDFISFILLGAVLSSYVQTVFWGIGYALKNDMDSGVLESNWLMPVPRPLLLVGRTLSSMLLTTITSLAMLLVAALVFGFQPTGSAALALVPAIPMLIGLYGFGMAFAAVVLLMRDANTLVDVSSYVVNLFSGSSFPVQALPRFLLPVSLAIPLTYGFDAVRGILLKTDTFLPVEVEVALLVVFMVVMTAAGVVTFARVDRRVRTLGTLGQH